MSVAISGSGFQQSKTMAAFTIMESWLSGRHPALREKRLTIIKMFYTYILKSKNCKRYYIGSTANLEARLISHNYGKVKSTKAFRPWEVIYREEYITKQEAYKREKEIKAMKSGIQFKTLLRRDG